MKTVHVYQNLFCSAVFVVHYTYMHSSLQEEAQQARVPSEATPTSQAQERSSTSTGHPSPSSSRGRGKGQAGKVYMNVIQVMKVHAQ